MNLSAHSPRGKAPDQTPNLKLEAHLMPANAGAPSQSRWMRIFVARQ